MLADIITKIYAIINSMIQAKNKKLLSQRNKVFYLLAVSIKRFNKYISWYTDNKKYASRVDTEKLKYRVKKHQSILVRKLENIDLELQYNKVTNIKIAISRLNGIIINPNETFSFCKLVGLPTAKKGYLEGMELSFGKAKKGVGGGICQIANLINWLIMHSSLDITQRHHHSFDPFPDKNRILPFGSGATIFYNYIDYQFTNNTPYKFQLNFCMDDKCLHGELRVNEYLDYTYHVFEKEHQFIKVDNEYFRKNQIHKEKRIRFTNELLESKMVIKNFSKVMYEPKDIE